MYKEISNPPPCDFCWYFTNPCRFFTKFYVAVHKMKYTPYHQVLMKYIVGLEQERTRSNFCQNWVFACNVLFIWRSIREKIPTSKIALFPPYFGGSFLHQIVIGTFTQRKKALDRPGADVAAVTVLIANSKQAPSRLVQERLLLLRRL